MQAAQKGPSGKAARSENPEAYAFWYVEGFERLRTQREGLFSSLKNKSLHPYESRDEGLTQLRGTTLIWSEDQLVVKPFIQPLTEARRNLLLHVRRFGSEASSATSRLVCTTHQLSSEYSATLFRR